MHDEFRLQLADQAAAIRQRRDVERALAGLGIASRRADDLIACVGEFFAHVGTSETARSRDENAVDDWLRRMPQIPSSLI
ncbi:hypothetical protein J2802_004311 [Paraburkholderia caribensis]|nr:hypothetical protein [Paraburkholderia caribensis]